MRINHSFKDALAFSIWTNGTFVPPLPEEEVIDVVDSIWKRHQKGLVISGVSLLRKERPLETTFSIPPVGPVILPGPTGVLGEEKNVVSFHDHVWGTDDDEMKRLFQERKQNWRSRAVTELPELPGLTWLFDGYICKGQISELVGIWKAGKTTLIAEILRSMNTGEDLFGRKVARATALVITATKFPLNKGGEGVGGKSVDGSQ